MFSSDKPISLQIGVKETLCKEELSVLQLVKFQTDIGGEGVILNQDHNSAEHNSINNITIGGEAILRSSDQNKISIVSDDIYARKKSEKFLHWIHRIDRLHISLCASHKIIASSPEGYASTFFKHQQNIYLVNFPVTVYLHGLKSIKHQKVSILKTKKEKNPAGLIRYLEKIKLGFEIYEFSPFEIITEEVLRGIINSKSIFWVGDLSLICEMREVNPISLSMASIEVHVNDLSSYGSVTGLTFEEWIEKLAKKKRIPASLAQQIGKSYLNNPKYSVVSSLKAHLS